MSNLKITEIFYSLQGETRFSGLPTVFVRLTGCPLRCQYCDTEYAFHGGKRLSFDEIFDQISQYDTEYVCVTGGEPLAQPDCIPFMNLLCDKGYRVSLETSGAMSVADVDERVSKVVDFKTPDSKEESKNHWENLAYLTEHDQVKFVICSRKDYEWAKSMCSKHELSDKCEVLFSPSFLQLKGTDLADWILQDQLGVRFQTQLHKQLWNDEPGR